MLRNHQHLVMIVCLPVALLAGAASLRAQTSSPGLTLEGANGFRVVATTATGPDRQGAAQASVRFESPWGEALQVSMDRSRPGHLRFTLDGGLTIAYRTDRTGRVLSMQVDDGQRQSFIALGGRAERYALGLTDTLDATPYEIIAARLGATHSPDFLAGVTRLGQRLTVPSGCLLELGSCAIAIAAWGIDIVSIAGACGSGLVPGCIAAIVAHELASAGLATSCGGYLVCLQGQPV